MQDHLTRLALFRGNGAGNHVIALSPVFDRATGPTEGPVGIWMPSVSTRWHFVLRPEGDGDLSAFLQRLTNTHTQRWQRAKKKVGHGHLYQGRFKSFPVERDDHFYTLVRYVERNALRANRVETAEAWRWGSLWRRVHSVRSPLLTDWPLSESRNWTDIVNPPQTEAEVSAIRRCILRGCPYGNDNWVQRTAASLGLESTLRPRGRPKVVEKRPDR